MARIYRSTDAGAPTVAGNDNTALIRLLTACLIDGYGNKTPAGGWTKPFGNAAGNAAVFRNDFAGGATGFYLRLDSTGATYRNNVQCYEGMSDVNTGVFPFPLAAVSVDASSGINSIARPWVVVATHTFCLVLIWPYATSQPARSQVGRSEIYSTGFFFGDIERRFPSDAFACVFSQVGQGNCFGAVYHSSSVSATTYNNYWMPRKSGGASGAMAHYGFLPHPASGASCAGASGAEFDDASGLLCSKLALNDGAAYTLRGWLPEIIIPLHCRPFEHLERVSIPDGDLAGNYVALLYSQGSNSSPYVGELLVKLDDGA